MYLLCFSGIEKLIPISSWADYPIRHRDGPK